MMLGLILLAVTNFCEAQSRVYLGIEVEVSPSARPPVYSNFVRGYLNEGWEEGFFDGLNSIRNWMQFGKNEGRESAIREFSLIQLGRNNYWSTCFYNARAASVWEEILVNDEPQIEKELQFEEGSVMVQLIWTDAEDEAEKATVSRIFQIQKKKDAKLEEQTLSLVSVNFAVRDSRVDESGGWVFGTFGLDEEARSEDNPVGLVPLGLTWGNDPQLEEGVVSERGSQDVKQSWIAPVEGNFEAVASEQGRLVGFGMPKRSSCFSCHSTAQFESVSAMLPPNLTSPENRSRWFRNLTRGEAFDRGRKSLDFSLGLSALMNESSGEEKKVVLPETKERLTRKPVEPDIYPE